MANFALGYTRIRGTADAAVNFSVSKSMSLLVTASDTNVNFVDVKDFVLHKLFTLMIAYRSANSGHGLSHFQPVYLHQYE